ncbi:MAG: bifunctional riboflavin kinase/FAD synthetase [Alphaproteobacteria bacterium]|nr:bifunctional riboflavin kinase/FAD synthetase [Alphaproteobacteria bacterium]
MTFFDNYQNLPEHAQNCVIAIGNFDGVHCGHQALLTRAKNVAEEIGKPLGVLTFEPHPRQLFRPDEPPYRITPPALKRERLYANGVDHIFSLPFDWDFASQSAEKFIQNILIEGLKASHVLVGKDFRFGQMRKGCPDAMQKAGLNVTTIDKVIEQKSEDFFSSSMIRQHLRHGNIKEANHMLGWEWEIRGEVFKGDQRGRELGYPTANMRLEDTIHPAYGIYACLVKRSTKKNWMKGATNIGIRPMFKVPMAQVETFIFDFDEEIYGETLHVRPVERLRSEAKFDSLDELIDQMEKDCEQAKEVLKNY